MEFKPTATQCTRWELFMALSTGGPLGSLIIVNAVEREDGSNHSYNIKGYGSYLRPMTIHVKTRD